MSVLRKRSPWILPAVSLLVGSLAMGLAGCGGDDSPFPGPSTQPISVVSPTTQTASSPTAVGSGGGTVSAGAGIPASTGVTNATVVVPSGALGSNQTLGVAVVAPSQSVLELTRAQRPGSVSGLTGIAEIAIGPVNANNTINTANSVGFNTPATITLELTPAQLAAAQAQQANGNILTVRQVIGQGQNAQLVQLTDATVSINPTNRTLTISGVRGTGVLAIIGTPQSHEN